MPIRFPLSTILTVLLTLVGIKALSVVAPLILPLIIAALIAVALTPVVNWLTARRLPRQWAIVLVVTIIGVLLCALIYSVIPSVYAEARNLYTRLPELRINILNRLGTDSAFYPLADQGLRREAFLPKTDQLKHLMGAGNFVLGGFAEFILVLILSVYLLIDGPRAVQWLKAFFELPTQEKITATENEVSGIVSAYVLGQFLTSSLAFLFAYTTLSSLGVPNALLLATLTGVLDVIPVLGFVLSVGPAMIFAANVSVETSWLVLVLYIAYHALENYLIVPIVYGNRLRLSSFVVFFSLLAAGLLGGITGALVVLPIVASYPIIERIWLRRYVRTEALVEHSAEKKTTEGPEKPLLERKSANLIGKNRFS